MAKPWLVALATTLAACGGGGTGRTSLTLRAACDARSYWNESSCVVRGDGADKLAQVVPKVASQDVENVAASIDEIQRAGGPLDHTTNVTLWEQRGIAAGFLEDEPRASESFDMLLALDPTHILSYKLPPQVTLVFARVREAQRDTGAPAIDVNWSHGQRVGDPVPLDVEVVADPKKFFHRATLFVRTRGESSWRAADIALARKQRTAQVVLPPITGTRSTSLEVYLRAYDDKGNEVLAWADPKRPREIPLRYDPPTPWWRKGWVIAAGLGAIGLGTGVTVYAITSSPPDKVNGSTVAR